MTVRIVAGYACVLGITYVLLALWVIQGRNLYRVGLGMGGVTALERRIRVHANFAEYVPFTLLLAGLAELEGVAALALHAICVGLIAGRCIHAWAVSQPEEPSGRVVGMAFTLTALASAALAAGYGSLTG